MSYETDSISRPWCRSVQSEHKRARTWRMQSCGQVTKSFHHSHCVDPVCARPLRHNVSKVRAGEPPTRTRIICVLLATFLWSSIVAPGLAADLSEDEVKQAIDRGKKFLIQEQSQDGSWQADADIRTGICSLCVLALLNSGMSPQDPPVRRGLQYLRSRPPEDYGGRYETYQVSLLIMALSAAKERSDAVKIADLCSGSKMARLPQITRVPGRTGWVILARWEATRAILSLRFLVCAKRLKQVPASADRRGNSPATIGSVTRTTMEVGGIWLAVLVISLESHPVAAA